MKTNRINIITVVCILALTSLVGASETNDPANISNSAVISVEMTNTMKFVEDTVRIQAGETVKWVNTSLLAHSVTADPSQSTIEGSAELPDGAKPFDSGMMDPDQTYKHTFTEPGTYQYFCIPHEGAKMFGWVIVEE